jgi:hypothetical protein
VLLAGAAIAVVAAFVILRSITDESAGSDRSITAGATTTLTATTPPATTGVVATTTTSTTTTTVAPAAKTDATIVVVNASGVGGSATALSNELAADGYATAPVANSSGPRLERSIIYYVEQDPRALGVARLLAEQMPTAQTLPMPAPPPLDRPLNAATVAVMLGTDAAGRPLAELRGG